MKQKARDTKKKKKKNLTKVQKNGGSTLLVIGEI